MNKEMEIIKGNQTYSDTENYNNRNENFIRSVKSRFEQAGKELANLKIVQLK